MRKFITLALFLTLALTACGASGNQAENAGKAMAETACLLFDDSADLANLETATGDIMGKYGWGSPEEIDTYLAGVQGTEELNAVITATQTHLESECGDKLTENGVTAADLANAMTAQ